MSGGWTKGPWAVESGTSCVWGPAPDLTDTRTWGTKLLETCVTFSGRGYQVSSEEAIANAILIAEAGTVANETGLTPRQLADQNKKLLAALREVIPANLCITNPNVADDQIVPVDVTMGEFRKIAALIAKCTGAA